MTTATKETPAASKKDEKSGTKNGMDSIAAALGKTETKKGDGKTTEAGKTDGEPKAKPETPKEIKTIEDLTKAIWSSRGNLYCPVQGCDFPIAIVKSDLVNALKEMDQTTATMYDLKKRDDGTGADLVLKKVAGAKT